MQMIQDTQQKKKTNFHIAHDIYFVKWISE